MEEQIHSDVNKRNTSVVNINNNIVPDLENMYIRNLTR